MKFIFTFCFISMYMISGCLDAKSPTYLSFKTVKELQGYLAYNGDGSILISGHRGGKERGYPENSIESFERVLEQGSSIFEIDPRLTKDSVIVLMHDATLDRTTTAKGKLSDYTWAELQEVRLKDHTGQITSAKIPTLEDVIRWSKGKTVLNLDKKDVPLRMIVDLIKKHKAENHVILTVHSGAQARYYFDRLPDILFSAHTQNEKQYQDMVICGVPWERMIAYLGPSIHDGNRHIAEQLRREGVRCMISFTTTIDRVEGESERRDTFKKQIKEMRPDIVESDFPIEIQDVLLSQ